MTLHAAPVDTNLSILSPFNNNLIRTGTIADGSCFFHAVLTSTKPFYRVLPADQKTKMVENLRNDIANSITFKVWKDNYCNKSSFVTISQLFWSFFKMYFNFITSNQTTDNIKHIQPIINEKTSKHSTHIFEVIPISYFQKITEDSYNTFEQDQRNDKKTTLQQIFEQKINIALRNKFLMLEKDNFTKRSQDLKDCYHDAGQFIVGKANSWLTKKPIIDGKTLPIIIPRFRVQDIDDEADWIEAELKFSLIKGDFKGRDLK